MLNYNKIESSINYRRTAKRVLASYLGIADSTLRDRLERQNLTPNDVEKIAEFYKKPIAYYFDKENEEEQTTNNESNNEKENLPLFLRGCKLCKEKDERINELKERIEELKERIEEYKGKELKGNDTKKDDNHLVDSI